MTAKTVPGTFHRLRMAHRKGKNDRRHQGFIQGGGVNTGREVCPEALKNGPWIGLRDQLTGVSSRSGSKNGIDVVGE